MRGLAAFVLIGVGLAACTAEGRRYSAADSRAAAGMGVVYVYRPEGELLRRGEPPYVTISGKSYGRLKPGSFVRAALPEGEHDVVVQQTVLLLLPTIPKTVTVAVVPGSRSYVRVDQRITDIGTAGSASVMQETSIEEVDPETAQSELAQLHEN
jgi:hypothetical protein